ncbi:hypothetical protein GGP77_002733 [Salinibacter ruber]|uniref:hypothetical protein n=1 Tax=Salinibacter ruber TaxID=146919 RepID=UPI002169981F|nr:hypothetical protein [Salinibacter ruber]MCS3668485.1 hypothetical protein [Salinibacter ruber]
MAESNPALSSDAPSPSTSEGLDPSLPHPSRRLTSGTPSQSIQSALQGLFAAELLNPGPDLWMALPRIWNVSILNNRANSFHHLEPTWPQSEVRLLNVLEKVMQEGTIVRVIASDHYKNETFAGEFRNLEAARSRGDYRAVSNWAPIESGIVASSFCVRGALQFSQHGLSVTGGEAHIYAENGAIEDYKHTFEDQWLTA